LIFLSLIAGSAHFNCLLYPKSATLALSPGLFSAKNLSKAAMARSAASTSLVVALAGALAAFSTSAHADVFPTKPVRLVVPFAAGGTLDALTRVLAEQLQAQWRQTVLVENRVGASGNVGADFVAHSEPDGHTLLASPPPPLAVNQFLFKAMPFKPSDFVIVTVLANVPNVLVAYPSVPASNLPELIALAKATPGKLNYASTGRGGTPHLTMEWFMLSTRINLVHVPYPKGFAPALNDLVGGHVNVMFANLADANALVAAGQLKAIAVASAEPIDALPGVMPISREVAGFESVTWFALAAPRGTAPSTVETIFRHISVAMKDPRVVDRLRMLSLTPMVNTPTEATTFVQEEAHRWQKVINLIGLPAE
jgi:tripartite-type tricarboxylate transporter receptor subunit TctC